MRDVTRGGVIDFASAACFLAIAAVLWGGDGPSLLVRLAPAFAAAAFIGVILMARTAPPGEGGRPTSLPVLFAGLAVLYAVFVAPWGVGLGSPGLLGAFAGTLFLVVGQGRRRFYAYAAVAVTSALVVTLLGGSTAWVAALTGAALLVGGTLAARGEAG